MSSKFVTWKNRIKSFLDLFNSISSLLLVISIIISVIPQIVPSVSNPLVVEGAKYVTIVLISFLGSYLLFRKMEKRMEESKMLPLDRKINTSTQKVQKEVEEHKKTTEQNFAELNTRIAQFTDFRIKQEQEHVLLNGKVSWIYGLQCPVCKRWIDVNLPNTIISGVHTVDGQRSDHTSRSTYEIDARCPQCGRTLHLDMPLSAMFKAKPN
jgi:hypothetical protein